MGFEMTITSKGQMTVPKIVREQLNMQPGDKCYAWVRNGEMIVIPRSKPVAELLGFARSAARGDAPASETAMRDSVADAAVERFLRNSEKDLRKDGES
ncbi:AbrB family transcriptional regulator [Xaviernesmea oryzae]|uniref:AbrB family transcriptional regulator n=1 Tax=Xaviernesmea oryzae TaxID=464029 RepID=A0A1Q9AZI7_9HYPH|nr:AbrB/MazE/SpoVT family DNA-binding domain-containing protein [Xaviernesmea oryzae]OLP61099.1 AbrB family transcriptional regulator [Xaviernesmea oryzae]SEL13459.1 looped-hinge helix DNA binding domain-containing protein, AbrB family [Xaviernesmea oryzae]